MSFNHAFDPDNTSNRPLLKALRHDPLMIIGLYGVLILLIFTLFAPWIAPYDLNQHHTIPLMPSAWSDAGQIAHFFGTDSLGRDILSHLIYGTKATFGSALVVTGAVICVGIAVGTIAGIKRGFFSAFLNHIFDIFISIPTLLLMFVIIVFIGPGLHNAMLAVALSLLPRVIHTIYTAVRTEMDKEYVIASRLDGANTLYILKDSIWPNIMPVIVSECMRVCSMAILDISALGFLGLGVQTRTPEWGAMLRDMIDLFHTNPPILILPGMAILISVLLINLLGDGIQRSLSARSE